MLCNQYLVSGRVQGVFYRASTQKKAQALGLTGWTKNLADGRVEVLACGEEAKLKELEAWLWQGPSHASVEAIEVTAIENDEAFDSFGIRY